MKATYPPCIGAYWDEINMTVHKGFSLSGELTNGLMRDLRDLPDSFPVLAGFTGHRHGFVRVNETATPRVVVGVRNAAGDLDYADRHGALVSPREVLPELESAIQRLLDMDEIVFDSPVAITKTPEQQECQDGIGDMTERISCITGLGEVPVRAILY